MTKFVSYVPDEAIEKDAQALLAEYAHARGVTIEAPIAIDDIIEKHLKIGIEFDDTHRLFGVPRSGIGFDPDILGAIFFEQKRIVIDESLDPDANPAKEGRYQQEDLIKLEQQTLSLLRAYDRDEGALDRTLASILEYNRLFMWDERRTQAQNERALESTEESLKRTLTDRPWKRCACRVCEAVGVEVAIFRSSNRNKRRGFHNLGVYYEYVRRQIDVSHEAKDLDLPSRRRSAGRAPRT